jgi:hypothetical protein
MKKLLPCCSGSNDIRYGLTGVCESFGGGRVGLCWPACRREGRYDAAGRDTWWSRHVLIESEASLSRRHRVKYWKSPRSVRDHFLF